MESEFYFRGMFMSLFIDIEFLLGDSLATLLVGENELKFNILEYVNPKLMLDGKITLVFNFLKRKNNTVFIKYKELLNDLRDYGSLRNDFAHKKITVNINNSTLNFIVINNGNITNNTLTFQDLETKAKHLKEILRKLNLLQEELIII